MEEKRIIFDLHKGWCQALKRILLAADRGQYKNVFNMIHNLWIPWKLGISLLATNNQFLKKDRVPPRQINLYPLPSTRIFTTSSENRRVSNIGQFIFCPSIFILLPRICQNSVSNSEKTHNASIKKNNILILFKIITANTSGCAE